MDWILLRTLQPLDKRQYWTDWRVKQKKSLLRNRLGSTVEEASQSKYSTYVSYVRNTVSTNKTYITFLLTSKQHLTECGMMYFGAPWKIEHGQETDWKCHRTVCKSQQCCRCPRCSGRMVPYISWNLPGLSPLTHYVQHPPWMHNCDILHRPSTMNDFFLFFKTQTQYNSSWSSSESN